MTSLEVRIRRTLKRRGLKLRKSRRHDPLALDFARCQVLDRKSHKVIVEYQGKTEAQSLQSVADWMDAQAEKARAEKGGQS